MRAPIEMGKTPSMIRNSLKAGRLFFRTARIPVIGARHPFVNARKTDMRFVPVNESLAMPGDIPLPVSMLDTFIEEASYRSVVDFCGCRVGFECENYPQRIGCIHLGDGAREAPKSVCHEVSIEEAKEHARSAIGAGLVPYVGKAHVDDYIYGIKDQARFMTICFCCECCCSARFLRDIPLKYLEGAYPRLAGVTVTVTDACEGCGKCVERCFIDAIEVAGGTARIGEYCRACGRCAIACPNNAIEIAIDDKDYMEKTLSRIRSRVKHD
ncbi:MAG: 4Fe-4S binding protein [Candidatus Geothermincolia bacterium]